jgi:peroxiredoxin Q/BCP
LPSAGSIRAYEGKTRNTPLIDPPKATKGRRMSKKTRKKTSKKTSKTTSKTISGKTLGKSSRPSPAKAARAQSTKPVKTAVAKSRTQAANKPGKSAKIQPGEAATAASHKAPPKPSKPSDPREPSALKSPLAEGSKAPAFRLPRDGGGIVSLADYAGKKLVLFFYPRANTPGCTKEAIDFTRLSSAFAASKTAVLGISADPLKAQEAFRDKHELAVPLVSDEQHEMLEAYGVWAEKSMYGKVFMGIVRTTVLIGENGRILRIWRHVKVDGHADDVLAAVHAG